MLKKGVSLDDKKMEIVAYGLTGAAEAADMTAAITKRTKCLLNCMADRRWSRKWVCYVRSVKDGLSSWSKGRKLTTFYTS